MDYKEQATKWRYLDENPGIVPLFEIDVGETTESYASPIKITGHDDEPGEVLARQGLKDKWESRNGYIYIYNIVIIRIIIRRDGSGTTVPIRIRTDSQLVA